MTKYEVIPTPSKGPREGYLSRSAYFADTLSGLSVTLGNDIGTQTDADGNKYYYPRGFMVLADGDVTIRTAVGGTADIALVGLKANTIYPIAVKRFTSSGASPLTNAQIVVLY